MKHVISTMLHVIYPTDYKLYFYYFFMFILEGCMHFPLRTELILI